MHQPLTNAVTLTLPGACGGFLVGGGNHFGDVVVFREIDTVDRAAVAEWGRAGEVLLDGRILQKGPPPSYEAIRRAIEKRVRKLPRA